MKNILELLEKSAGIFPEKIAVSDPQKSLTYKRLLQKAQAAGSALASLKQRNAPIAVFMNKSPDSLAAFFSVVYSGNFYVVIDAEMPADRIKKIFSVLSPSALLTEQALLGKRKGFFFLLFCFALACFSF